MRLFLIPSSPSFRPPPLSIHFTSRLQVNPTFSEPFRPNRQLALPLCQHGCVVPSTVHPLSSQTVTSIHTSPLSTFKVTHRNQKKSLNARLGLIHVPDTVASLAPKLMAKIASFSEHQSTNGPPRRWEDRPYKMVGTVLTTLTVPTMLWGPSPRQRKDCPQGVVRTIPKLLRGPSLQRPEDCPHNIARTNLTTSRGPSSNRGPSLRRCEDRPHGFATTAPTTLRGLSPR